MEWSNLRGDIFPTENGVRIRYCGKVYTPQEFYFFIDRCSQLEITGFNIAVSVCKWGIESYNECGKLRAGIENKIAEKLKGGVMNERR